MDQFGQTNNNDLQKAIDEITSNGAAPVADASADNTAVDLGQPPVPAADNIMPPTTGAASSDNVLADVVPPVPEVPAEPVNVNVASAPADVVAEPVATDAAPVEAAPVADVAPVDVNPVADVAPAEPTPSVETAPAGDLVEVKKSALHELAPIIDMVDLPSEKRFEILSEVIDETKDKAIVSKALDAAKGIADEKLKAESLLKLVEMIDTL